MIRASIAELRDHDDDHTEGDWFDPGNDPANHLADAWTRFDCDQGTERTFLLDEDGEYIEPPDEFIPMQQGELWLDGDSDYINRGHAEWRTKKPQPSNALLYCKSCDWPTPVNWSWSKCEFGEPRQAHRERLINDHVPGGRAWWFCHCNGCLDLNRGRGRPHEYCGKRCRRDADNARDRARRRSAGAIPRNRSAILTVR